MSPIPITERGLDYFLSAVDEHLEIVADAINARVVPHTWCLLPKEQPFQPSVLSRFDLPDFLLAAQVEIVAGLQIQSSSDSSYWDTYEILQQTSDKLYRENGWYIPDIAIPSQYLRENNNDDNSVSKVTLVDIEPRVVDYSL